MKTLSICFVLIAMLITSAQAQEFRGAEIGLQVSNQVDRSGLLVLGVREGASSGLDLTLEEYELPPVPPNEIFDARIISTPGQSQLGLGGIRDYRAIESSTEAFTLTYTIAWQCGQGSPGIQVSWSDPYPSRVTALSIDGADMAGETEWTSTFAQGQATVRVTFNYKPLEFTATPPSLSFDINDRNATPSKQVELVTLNDANAAWLSSVDATWLSVDPSEGNGSETLTVTVTSTDMPRGNYNATISIRSPLYSVKIDVPVTLSLTVGVNDPPFARPDLLLNYPNPFAGGTVLHVRAVPREGLTLRVFDALGRQVADLTSLLEAGTDVQRIPFDAGALPPGIYTCRLESGETTVSRSMVLLK
jgi:hypothetical protein